MKNLSNTLLSINYSIFRQDFNDTQLPLKSIIIYEDKSEFSFDYLSHYIHYIKTLSESFSFVASQSETKYLSLNITPKFQIEKFNIAYNMTNEIKTIYDYCILVGIFKTERDEKGSSKAVYSLLFSFYQVQIRNVLFLY